MRRLFRAARAPLPRKRGDAQVAIALIQRIHGAFHQRIRREGDALHAWIAGPGRDGGEMRIPFEYRRCGG